MFIDFLCNQKLRLVEQSCYRPAGIKQPYNLFSDCRVVAAQYRRSSGLQEVYISVAVVVIKICAVCFGHTHRKRLVKRQIVLHASRYVLL